MRMTSAGTVLADAWNRFILNISASAAASTSTPRSPSVDVAPPMLMPIVCGPAAVLIGSFRASRVVLDSDATRAALKYFMALSEVSSSLAPQFDELTNNTAFLESQISMTQNATSIYWNASQDKRDLAAVMNHARYPEGPAGTHQLAEINLIAIFNHTRNEAAAKDWIRFMMQGDQRRSKSIESSLFFAPPLAKFSDDHQMPWNTEQKFAGFRSSADAVRGPGWPGPASVEGSLVYANGSILRMFQAVGNGTMAVNEAISAASNELRRVYET